MNRELDLGRLLEKVGKRIQEEGQTASQKFHDWKRVEQLEVDSTRGGGLGDAPVDMAADRRAAKMAADWLHVRVQLQALAVRAAHLMDEAKGAKITTDGIRPPGWCRSHWQIGEQVPVSVRTTGEPYYRELCKWCGDNKPTIEDLKRKRDGKPLRMSA